MDDGRGNLVPISETRYNEMEELRKPRSFQVGEIVEVKGSRFRITKIESRGRMKLKLLPDE